MSAPVIKGKTYRPPEADYYEGTPEAFDVYSWSPSPVGTPLDQSQSTQVHLHGLVSFGRLYWRFKSNRTLDRLIAALVKHRWDVWSVPYEKEAEEELRIVRPHYRRIVDEIRDRALEEAASLFESVNPASDSERARRTPGADAMGAVLEFRDLIRARKGKR